MVDMVTVPTITTTTTITASECLHPGPCQCANHNMNQIYLITLSAHASYGMLLRDRLIYHDHESSLF